MGLHKSLNNVINMIYSIFIHLFCLFYFCAILANYNQDAACGCSWAGAAGWGASAAGGAAWHSPLLALQQFSHLQTSSAKISETLYNSQLDISGFPRFHGKMSYPPLNI
jgi:hypothetical protein